MSDCAASRCFIERVISTKAGGTADGMAAPERNCEESAARFTASGSLGDSNPAADKRP